MLWVEGLNAYYGKGQVVQGVDLTVELDAVSSILGRNGVGKTTTLKAVMGLVRREGSLRFGDQEIGNKEPHQIADMGIGYVPQGRELFPDLTVGENIILTVGRDKVQSEVFKKIFEYFPALHPLVDRLAGSLSGGEQQMVAISRAVARDPKIILMDEPIEGLAPTYIRVVKEVIQALRAEGRGILLVEQNYKMALELSSDVYFMDKGRVVHYTNRPTEVGIETIEKYLGVGHVVNE